MRFHPVSARTASLTFLAPVCERFTDHAATLAVASAALGLVVERWLFFAEAKHTVTLYYGAETA